MSSSDDSQQKINSVLRDIYYSVGVSPLAYSQNANAIAKKAKQIASEANAKPHWFTLDRVKEFLKKQLPTQFFKPKRVNFQRTVFFSPGINR